MKLIIENIGSITHVAVELGNLTVIAGENDVGKSTVGRVFFALVQAFSNYPVALKKMNNTKMRRVLERILMDIRKYVPLSQHPEFRRLFSLPRRGEIQDLDSYFNELTHVLKEFENHTELPSEIFTRAQSQLAALYAEVHEPDSEDDAIANAIFRALRSEFTGEIINKYQTNNAKITVVDGATTILEITFDEAGVIEFKGSGPLGLEDATLVEGPAILQYRNALGGFDEIGEPRFFSGSIPFHSIDLVRKLRNSHYATSEISSSLPVQFQKLYEGEMGYDDDADDFLLKRGLHKISSNNTATGIKALAILELLIKGDYVREDTILILDEPETSLHPKWQIAYAKIICALTELGARVLVTTHSPYMLEALKGYSSKNAENYFYLAQKERDNAIHYHDTSGDISPIIAALSQPLEDLIDEIGHDF